MRFTKGDAAAIAAVLIIAAAIWAIPALSESGEGKLARVSQGEKEYMLSLSKDTEIRLDGVSVAVNGGEIYVFESTCPDKTCEKTGRISRPGESIICVPNKVSVTVLGEDAAYDAITG